MWRPWIENQNVNVEVVVVNVEDEIRVEEGEIRVEDEPLNYEDEAVENAEENFDNPGSSKQRHFLPPLAKQIILNVYNTLKEKKEVREEKLIETTAEYTKMPYASVWRIVKLGFAMRKERVDKGLARKLKVEEHAYTIRRIIYDAYKNNYVPTLKYIQEKIAEFIGLQCCFETIRLFLGRIGFDYKTLDKRHAMRESRTISEWRYKYLAEIKKFREENRCIIFLDETWYDSHDVVKKGFVDNSGNCVLKVPPSRGQRIIILHAGSKQGFVPEALYLSGKNIKDAKVDYHDEMTGDIFFDWFSTKLLKNVPANSIIVMDNASYHSVQAMKIPNSGSRKEEIADFLRENDLYYEDHYTKKQLLEVLHTKSFDKRYVIDEEAAKYGHYVLRLPPYHCELNPIEMIWSILKSRVRRYNTNPKFSASAIDVIRTQVNTITENEWSNCVKKVISIEEEYSKRQVNELVIYLDDSSDEEDNV